MTGHEPGTRERGSGDTFPAAECRSLPLFRTGCSFLSVFPLGLLDPWRQGETKDLAAATVGGEGGRHGLPTFYGSGHTWAALP